jgi:hypothetical protein
MIDVLCGNLDVVREIARRSSVDNSASIPLAGNE